MDPKADALTDEQKHVGDVFDAIPRCMVLGVTPEHIHTLQAAAKHPRIFRDLVEPILDGILSLPQGTPLRTPLEISKCKDQDAMTATVLLWLASHEGQVSDIGKATGDFLREFTTNLLNWRRELMKASATGRAYPGAWAPDLATIALPEVEVEGVGGVQGLVAQAVVAAAPASAASPEERQAPMLSPREEVTTAAQSVEAAARAALDSHFEAPLPLASGSASEEARDAGELDGIDEADEADDELEAEEAEGDADEDADHASADNEAQISDADTDAAAEATAGQAAAQPSAASATTASNSPWLQAAMHGVQADSQPADATAGGAAPAGSATADSAPGGPATEGSVSTAAAATGAAASSGPESLVVDTGADSSGAPASEPGTAADSNRSSRSSSSSGPSFASHSSPGAATAALASPQSAFPSSAPLTPQLLSPQRTVPTTPRTVAKAATLEGKARNLRRAVSFSEKAISHADDVETRALHRQLSRLFDDGAQTDDEDDCDAELRSAALSEVKSSWRRGGAKLSARPTAGAAAESAEEEAAYSPIELSIEVYKAMKLDACAFGSSLSAVAQVCDTVADCVCNYGKASLAVGLGQLIVKKARVMLAQFWTLRKSATLVMSSTMEVRSRRRVLRDRKAFAATVTHTLEESLDELRDSVASYEEGKRELVRREAALKGWEVETRAMLLDAKHDFEAQIAESTRLVAGLREKLDAALKEVKEEQRKVVVAQQCKPTLDWYRSRAEELEKELAASKLRVAALEHELSTQ